MRKTISDALARRTKSPSEGRTELFDTVIPGFGLRVTERGLKSWFVMTRLTSGMQVRITLGRFPGVGLSAARKSARKTLEQVAQGEDPRRPRGSNASRIPGSFGKVADEFLTRAAVHTKTHRETKRIIERELRNAWGARPIRQITRREIVALLDAIVDRGAPVMANRTLTVIKRIFAFALDRDLVDASPCAKLKPPGGKERARSRVLTSDELRALWRAWDRDEIGFAFATFFRVTLLTAQRRSEVAGMRWRDLDLDGGLWRLEDTKAGWSHEVPLGPQVVDLLRSTPRQDECVYVFSTNGRTPISGFSKVCARVSTAAKVSDWTIHDLRRTAASEMTALGVPADHVERVLGHVLPGMRRVYVRHEFLEEKRTALESWETRVLTLTADRLLQSARKRKL